MSFYLLKFSKYFLSFLVLILTFISCSNDKLHADKNSIQISLTNFQYFSESTELSGKTLSIKEVISSANWKSIASPKEINAIKKGEIIWLKTIPPDSGLTYPSIYLGQIVFHLQVFFREKLIYEWGDFSSNSSKYLHWKQVLIPIEDLKKGEDVYFRIKMEDLTDAINNDFLFGSYVRIVQNIFEDNIFNFILFIIILIAGLLVSIIYFNLEKPYLLLSSMLFLFSMGVFVAVNNSFLQLIFSYPNVFYHLNYLSFNIGTISFYILSELVVIDKYKKIINILWKIKIAILIAFIFATNITDIIYLQVIKYQAIFGVLSLFMVIVFLLISALKSKYESKILIVGMAFIVVTAILEFVFIFIKGFEVGFGFKLRFLPIGIFFFVLSIIWLAVYNYFKTIKEKEKNQQLRFEAIQRENEAHAKFASQLIESQENERNRIALELHDSIGQKLLLVKNLILSKLKRTDSEEETKSLNGINELTGDTIDEIRSIIFNLRPQHLDNLGLTVAIETLIEKLFESSEIEFIKKIDNIDDAVIKADEINLFRIIQESLNNILKHSNADKAIIEIQNCENFIFVKVHDNGTGIEKNQNKLNGVGLNSIRERSKILEAELELDINGKNGTTIILKYPVKKIVSDDNNE